MMMIGNGGGNVPMRYSGESRDAHETLQGEVMDDFVRDPKLLSQAKGLILRALFAAVGTTVFLCGLLCGLMSWWIPIAVMVIFTPGVFVLAYASRNGNGPEMINQYFIRPTIRTNNLWFVWMVGFLIILSGFTFYSFMSMNGRQITEMGSNYARSVEQQGQNDMAERRKNRRLGLGYKTDAELKGALPQSPSDKVSLIDSIPSDPHRDTYHVRWTFWAILTFLTAAYFFFAFWDEFWDKVNSAKAVVREKAEGDTVKAVVEGAVKAAPTVATSVVTAHAGGPSWLKTLGIDMGGAAIWEAMRGFLRNFWRNMRRT
jgi:hypothetical protein